MRTANRNAMRSGQSLEDISSCGTYHACMENGITGMALLCRQYPRFGLFHQCLVCTVIHLHCGGKFCLVQMLQTGRHCWILDDCTELHYINGNGGRKAATQACATGAVHQIGRAHV